jgi:hypothetical protein
MTKKQLKSIAADPRNLGVHTIHLLEQIVSIDSTATLEDIAYQFAANVLIPQEGNLGELDNSHLLTAVILDSIGERFGSDAKAVDVLRATKEAMKMLNEIYEEDKGSTDPSVSGDERSHSE